MAIQFTCPSCDRPIEVDDELANQMITCPFCRNAASAPSASTLTGPSATPQSLSDTTLESSTPSIPLTNKYAWASLACVVFTVVPIFAVMSIAVPVGLEMGPNPDQKEYQRRLDMKMQEHPLVFALSKVSACAALLAGLGFGIVALIKQTPPRWPAVVALCLIGALVIALCISTALLAAALRSGAPAA